MLRTVLSAIAILALTACTTSPYTGERQAAKAAKGAGIGAAVGAVVGALTGDDADERRKRALIGAGVGALTGAGVGYYMDRQEAALRERLAGTGVKVVRMGDDLVLSLPQEITFGVNQADLRPQFEPVLSSVGEVMNHYDKTLVDVVGHTDSTGPAEYNQRLSEQRARSVARYLETAGVVGERVLTQGAGEHYPIAANETATGRAQNRRVELVLKPIVS